MFLVAKIEKHFLLSIIKKNVKGSVIRLSGRTAVGSDYAAIRHLT